jgi:alpha-galactosidase
MMKLWGIFGFPLMLGAELTKLDEWTTILPTNKKVLRLLSHSKDEKQIMRNKEEAMWLSKTTDENANYLAVFNLSDKLRNISVDSEEIDLDSFKDKKFEELWSGETVRDFEDVLQTEVSMHGAKLNKIQDVCGMS